MRSFRHILCFLAFFAPLPTFGEDQTENIRARISEADFIVTLRIDEQVWIPATPQSPKAELIRRGEITGVYKGAAPVGAKVEFRNLIEEPERFLAKTKIRSGPVTGVLLTFFFSRKSASLSSGKYTLTDDSFFSFPRNNANNDFAKAFREELKTNPALKPSTD